MATPLRLIAAFVSTAIIVGLSVVFVRELKAAQGEDLTKMLGVTQRLNAQLPLEAQLRDESGKMQTLGKLMDGKPTVLMFIFYNCRSSCILEFESANKAFRRIKTQDIGRDYNVLSISIHPKETPELASAKKSEYLALYNRPGADRGWRFLTGDEAEVQKIAKAAGIKYTYDEAKDRVIHPTGLVLSTPEGRVSKYLLGTEYPLLGESLSAARRNEIGVEAIPVLFGCFTYDPATGKTMVSVKGAIQLGGAITLIALVGAVVGMIRREKTYHNDSEDRPQGA